MGFLLKAFKRLCYLFLIVIIFVIIANVWIVKSTSDQVFSDYDSLTNHPVALILGTSHLLTSGEPNPFFRNRMETAANLYKMGKIKHFIVSGDNRTRYYNEPLEMKKALVKRGVPSNVITLDYAGLRTLDSIVRSKEIFGQEEITIVTQAFHCYRALFISNYYGIDAVAYVAQDPVSLEMESVSWREYFARAKAILDLYVLNTSPRHLGQKEPIQL